MWSNGSSYIIFYDCWILLLPSGFMSGRLSSPCYLMSVCINIHCVEKIWTVARGSDPKVILLPVNQFWLLLTMLITTHPTQNNSKQELNNKIYNKKFWSNGLQNKIKGIEDEKL